MNHKLKLSIIALFTLVISITSVYAVTIIASKDVIYDNSKSKSPANNVQAAIDDLYVKVDSCSVGAGGSTISKGVKLGDYVSMTPTATTYTIPSSLTGYDNDQTINPSELNLWRVIKVNDDGTVEMVSEYVSSTNVYFTGKEGYLNFVKGLNTIAAQYTNSKYVQSTRHIGYSNQTETLTDASKLDQTTTPWSERTSIYNQWTGCDSSSYLCGNDEEDGAGDIGYETDYNLVNGALGTMLGKTQNGTVSSYWLASRYFIYNKVRNWTFSGHFVENDGSLSISDLYWYNGSFTSYNSPYAIRPIVVLKSTVKIASGKGTEEDPYKLTDKVETPVDDSPKFAPPKLDDKGELIPVILSDEGKVTYVRESNSNWYNYDEKKWANAVILIDSPSKTYKVGDTIKEEDIESYFVWIPKYKYKLWNVDTKSGTKHEIDIIFDTRDTTDVEGVSCKTPMTSGGTGKCNNGEYMTHPAFISIGANGFWVGKFQTGYAGATTTTEAEVKSSDSSKIIIKPNEYSWRSNTVYNFFVSAYNYDRDLDSHMMKNTEWGAVAYLSHSKYGIGKEVNINNNSSYKTGYSALPSTDQHTYPGTAGDGSSYNQEYNTKVGYLASTTGNITGVYDMSGGAFQSMASYISGKPTSSGFTTTTLANYKAKYFDVYNEKSDVNTYQYRILGDATGEMGPIVLKKEEDGVSRWQNAWYRDESLFVDSSGSVFCRGGFYDYGVLAGPFHSDTSDGSADSYLGSRLVLLG